MAAKKQVPLRLSESLYNALAKWAEDDFRSVNGQIEYMYLNKLMFLLSWIFIDSILKVKGNQCNYENQ